MVSSVQTSVLQILTCAISQIGCGDRVRSLSAVSRSSKQCQEPILSQMQMAISSTMTHLGIMSKPTAVDRLQVLLLDALVTGEDIQKESGKLRRKIKQASKEEEKLRKELGGLPAEDVHNKRSQELRHELRVKRTLIATH